MEDVTILARSANLPTGLYVLLALLSFLMIAQLSQDLLERFLQSFHRMTAFWVQIIDLDLFSKYLKGRCHGNQFCGKIATPVISRSVIPKME